MKKTLVKLFVFCHLFISLSLNANNLHFAFFTQRASDDYFWQPAATFATEAAKQLDIKLTIFYANSSKREMLKNIKKASEMNVDAIISPNFNEIAYRF